MLCCTLAIRHQPWEGFQADVLAAFLHQIPQTLHVNINIFHLLNIRPFSKQIVSCDLCSITYNSRKPKQQKWLWFFAFEAHGVK